MQKLWKLAAIAGLLAAPVHAEEAADCLLEVGGLAYIEGPCEIEPMDDGFIMSAGQFFAYIERTDMSFWNAEPSATHAHDRLGILQPNGVCWANETAKACVPGETDQE